MTTALIVAADEDDVIGRDGALPWHLTKDLRRFKQLTDGHAVVAGRRTHESIVARLGHPLPGRYTVVVTRDCPPDEAEVAFRPDIDSALHTAAVTDRGEVFVIGGAQIYAQTLPLIDRIYLTRVHANVGGDTVMPAGWLSGFAVTARDRVTDDELPFSFLTYDRRP